jgi:hypothetical protein
MMVRWLAAIWYSAASVGVVLADVGTPSPTVQPSPRLSALLTERRDTLAQLADALPWSGQPGAYNSDGEVRIATSAELHKAQLAVTSLEAKRIELCRSYADAMRSIERKVEALYQAGARGGEAAKLYRARTRRLTAEIDLLSETIRARGNAPTAQETARLNELRVARRDAAQLCVDTCKAAIESDTITYQEMVSAWMRLHEARLALCATAADRLKECEDLSQTSAKWEERTRRAVDGDGARPDQLRFATVTRLESAVALEKERLSTLDSEQRPAAIAELKKLRQRLRDARTRYAEGILAAHETETVPLDALLRAWAGAWHSELDACVIRTEREQVLKKWKARLLEIERRLDAQTVPDGERGSSERYLYLQSKVARLDVEIQRELLDAELAIREVVP